MTRPPPKPSPHRRRSIRLRNYDYSQPGFYFITICAHKRQCLFGNIIADTMELNALGAIIKGEWDGLPERFRGLANDAFVIMPNHVHGILHWAPTRGAPTITIGNIIGAFKSLSACAYLDWLKGNQPQRVHGKLWQRNYWERVIRDETELATIRDYIQNNPAQWHLDALYSPAEETTKPNETVPEDIPSPP